MIQVTSALAFYTIAEYSKFTVHAEHGRVWAFDGYDLMGYFYYAENSNAGHGDFCETKQESIQMECDVVHPRFLSGDII